jgi:hypothetical protein
MFVALVAVVVSLAAVDAVVVAMDDCNGDDNIAAVMAVVIMEESVVVQVPFERSLDCSHPS